MIGPFGVEVSKAFKPQNISGPGLPKMFWSGRDQGRIYGLNRKKALLQNMQVDDQIGAVRRARGGTLPKKRPSV